MMGNSLNDVLGRLKIPESPPIEKLEELFNNGYFEECFKEWAKYYETNTKSKDNQYIDKIISEEYINDTHNLITIGYPKILCNPKNIEQLSEAFPDIAFTITNYVEEDKIILVKPRETIKCSIKKLNSEIG